MKKGCINGIDAALFYLKTDNDINVSASAINTRRSHF